MRSLSIGLVSFVSLGLAAGCAQVGNVLFTPHPNSLRESEPTLNLQSAEDCIPAPAERQSASSAAGVAIAAAQALLKAESKRYKATWSAANSTENILTSRCIGLNGRRFGTLKLLLAGERTATRIEDGTFTAIGAKSKVVSWPIRTFARTGEFPWPDSTSGKVGTVFGLVNPIMILHFVYGLIDGDAYKVDYAAKLRIESIGSDREVKATELTLKLGKLLVDDLAGDGTSKTALQTGYFPLAEGVALPANVTVSIIEANDLGDVIGKGAELVGEKKDSILGFFGVE